MGRVRQEGKKRNLVCVNTIDSAIWDFPCTINELNMGERTFAYRKFRPIALGGDHERCEKGGGDHERCEKGRFKPTSTETKGQMESS